MRLIYRFGQKGFNQNNTTQSSKELDRFHVEHSDSRDDFTESKSMVLKLPNKNPLKKTIHVPKNIEKILCGFNSPVTIKSEQIQSKNPDDIIMVHDRHYRE
jgi:hypothetical protein